MKYTLTLIGGGMIVLMLFLGAGCPADDLPPDNETPDENQLPDDGDGALPDDPAEGLIPPDDVFAGESDPLRIVSRATAGGIEYTFPTNEMMVLLAEGATQADAAALVARLGGTLVGQVPDLGLYQIRLNTTSAAELDVAIAAAELDGIVSSAGYNISTNFRQSCPSSVDNEDFENLERCPFNMTEYYQAITMFEFFRPYLRLNIVRVAVIDSGVDMATGEFDDAHIVFLNALSEEPTDFHPNRHGTAVTGMIAADNDGVGANGLASSFLPDHLLIMAGSSQRIVDELVLTRIAIALGARVVNLSLGWSPEVSGFTVYYDAWHRMLSGHPDVLFVCAAGDDHLELNGVNYAPGGIDLPNVITVGGLSQCDPFVRYPHSNYGRFVDVAASEEAIPVVSASGNTRSASGTSFAVPQVTSLAAVLLALRPSLTPSEVTRYMTNHGLPVAVNAGRARLTFTHSINQLLIDINVAEPVMGWIDPAGSGHAGSTGLVLSRICPTGMHLWVSEYGTHEIWEPEAAVDFGVLGSPVLPPSFSFGAGNDEVSMSFGSQVAEFMLGTYTIATDPGPFTAHASFHSVGTAEIGGGISGTLTIDACRIEERDPFDGTTPWIVRLTGEFEGAVEVVHWDPAGVRAHCFEGYYSIPVLVAAGEGDPVIEYLEYHCDGGIPPISPAASSQ